MIHNQCIVLQASTPNVQTLNLSAHPLQEKITPTPEGYLGVSCLVHINLKCVTIIFQPILKNWPNHKSGIMLFPNWTLCKKRVIFTNFPSIQVIVLEVIKSNAQIVQNVFQPDIYVMVTMTVETVLGLMNKVAGDLFFLLF